MFRIFFPHLEVWRIKIFCLHFLLFSYIISFRALSIVFISFQERKVNISSNHFGVDVATCCASSGWWLAFYCIVSLNYKSAIQLQQKMAFSSLLFLLEIDFLHQFFNAIHPVDWILRIKKCCPYSLDQSQCYYQFGQNLFENMKFSWVGWTCMGWQQDTREKTQKANPWKKINLTLAEMVTRFHHQSFKNLIVSNRLASYKKEISFTPHLSQNEHSILRFVSTFKCYKDKTCFRASYNLAVVHCFKKKR